MSLKSNHRYHPSIPGRETPSTLEMPITTTSPYGHKAKFHSLTARPADLDSITWTRDSIHVPASSPLNAPAEVWLKVPTTIARARRWCDSQNVEFLSLWDESGKTNGFGFRVQGFSRYKYVDSDDDAPPRRGVKADIDDEDTELPPTPLKPFQTVFDVPRGQDDDAVQRLRSALFDQKREDLTDDVGMRDFTDEETIPDERRASIFLDFGDGLSDDNTPSPPAMPVHELPYPIYDNSIATKREGIFCDTGLMLGRSTRVSFSKGKLANTRYQSRASAFTTGFDVVVDSVYGKLPPTVTNVLRVHCAAWFPTRDEKNEICNPGLVDAFRDAAVADRTIELLVDELWNAVRKGDEDSRHARVVFWLVLALYKGGDAIEVEGDCLIRRLAEWAEGEAGTLFDERPAVSALRKALIQLCVGRVEEAVDAAVEAGYVRLGMLISRAMENPKDDLRLDAESQLAVYGLVDVDALEDPDLDPERWDKVLDEATAYSAVSVDERMILLLLAGHVGAVARFMGFSWYRLFIMELLYGAGSSELTQPERVAAAVQAIEKGKIETTAPHAATKDIDVAYHLLRLYADATSKYPLSCGVYSTRSFGMTYRPLDSRFSWLLHQVLSSLIPEAGLKGASVALSDAFASQLRAGGMPLWAFYVLCCSGVSQDVLRATLVRDWPEMVVDRVKVSRGVMEGMKGDAEDGNEDDVMREGGEVEQVEEAAGEADTTDAEKFLSKILRVPEEWIYEAKALSARADGDKLEECRCWIGSRSEEGAVQAHELLYREVVPEVIVAHDTKKLGTVTKLLKDLCGLKQVPNWHSCGGLLLSYVERIMGAPHAGKLDMQELRSMVMRLGRFAERAESDVQRHAAHIMADGVGTAQRAVSLTSGVEGREALVSQLKEDVERLGCTAGVRKRLLGEYEDESKHGQSFSTRFSAALTCYTKFVKSEV